ncbi:MAG: fatty acid desaturase, partial [Sulfitobacter sp.]
MFDTSGYSPQNPDIKDARDWVKILSGYRDPSTLRSIFELAATLGPFVVLWALAWLSLSVSAWLTLAIS